MGVGNRPILSFVALDQRLRDVPEGPAGVFITPRWLKAMNGVAAAGALFGLMPYFLAKWLEPAQWMVYMAKGGLITLAVAVLPGFLRNCGVMGLQFWHWRLEQAKQLDHERAYVASILAWLAKLPATELAQSERVARLHLGQLTAKIGLLAGGVEKLGLLPVFVSGFLFVRQWKDLLAMPGWQMALGVFLLLLYVIVTTANLMRIRLQLYQSLLIEARAMQDRSQTDPGMC
ncbi:hypothetical protein CQ393_00890 [Stenotrophomonas sp. MYb238]|uniref:hypothetical protein n=1 Tax=Stenotrophomonas sp. MYb238 TaxID=2040281 RepID=UPI0012919162|nr:hypothetical protein [Stenotrophomonas sp. MYb238]MQP74450.1 hypothetical protein [Stenotrophomonas sp. MYb238]